MINLFQICGDLNSPRTILSKGSLSIIEEICSYYNRPSNETAAMIEAWKQDFSYIYGNVDTNLSSNSKLNVAEMLTTYSFKSKGNRTDSESIQLLFFGIQTYFSLFIKLILKETICRGEELPYSEIIMGTFTNKIGIKNYVSPDYYCWPVFELDNGFDKLMSRMTAQLKRYQVNQSVKEFVSLYQQDFIKQIYEALIPKQLRHALGEYYTPDWMAEKVLNDSIDFFNSEKGILDLRIVEPTCGSGTFILKIIKKKRFAGASLNNILETVFGMDINPLAVLSAKTNYVFLVLDLLFDSPNPSFILPIFNADMVKLDSVRRTTNIMSADFYLNPVENILYARQVEREYVSSLSNFDLVIGNPPWVNWEYLPEQYKTESQSIWLEYKLFNARGMDLSFSKEDISVLITYIAMDRLLKNGGVLSFVIRQGIFKSAQNGIGFRKFLIKDTIPIKVLRVDDLSQIKAFANATNTTAFFYARKNEITAYPVDYYVWSKRSDIPRMSFSAESALNEVIGQVEITQTKAMPAVKESPTSLWINAESNKLDEMKKFLGHNSYKARTGVFTGGANAVYWLSIQSCSDFEVNVSNMIEKAKRKVQQVSSTIEKTFVFPMLKGGNIEKWRFSYDTYLLMPHTIETKMWPVSIKEMNSIAPKTMNYLYSFKQNLDDRNGFAGWEKEIQKSQFHAVLRIGDYTFSEYKVIWKYIAQEFICAVIGKVHDQFLGDKLLIPNEKVMYVSTDNEDEAYYLCGFLSSTPVAECVKSYMNPTSISAHVLDKLQIPSFNPKNETHLRIAHACKRGHGGDDYSVCISEIDDCVKQLVIGKGFGPVQPGLFD